MDKIGIIVANFNFRKVAKTMKALKWEWYGEGVPGIGRLKEFSRFLLKEAVEHPGHECSISCGGFRVEKKKNNILSLQFIIAEWDSEGVD